MAFERKYKASDHFPNLVHHENLLSKVLSLELYEKLLSLRSKGGFTLDKCIQTGVDNPKSSVGCVAGDEDCYSTFADLFDPLIISLHGPYAKSARQDVCLSVNGLDQLNNECDPEYLLGYDISVKRNIRSYNLTPHYSRSERRNIERLAVEIMNTQLVGSYSPLKSMSEYEKEELTLQGLLLKQPVSTSWTHAMITRDWPDARGVWRDEKQNLAVWINRVNHLEFVMHGSKEDLKDVFEYMVRVLKKFENGLAGRKRDFMWNDHYGFLTVCPSDIGTALRAKFAIRLSAALLSHSQFPRILERLQLNQVEIDCEGGAWLEYPKTLGVTEFEVFQIVLSGASKLIQLQKKFEAGIFDTDVLVEYFFNPPSAEEMRKLEKAQLKKRNRADNRGNTATEYT